MCVCVYVLCPEYDTKLYYSFVAITPKFILTASSSIC